jgi:sugar phosphate isomerase/epimerase
MRVQSAHLTYCLNVHPAEAWTECFEAIRTHALNVRERIRPDASFGLGLRLSAQAARELAEPANLEAFRAFLTDHDLYVFTVNAFPYGRFHGGPVKERVYEPDWMTDERRDYTMLVADVLSELLPDGTSGSISTVPGAYRPRIRHEQDRRAVEKRLVECVKHLADIHRQTGVELHVGLEPEPACYLESTQEFLDFFKDVLLRHGRDRLCRLAGEGGDKAEEWIRRHLGVCLDTCHAALQFEDPGECLDRYAAEGVRISKIQISAALETSNSEPAWKALRAFDEPVYLHQTRARGSDGRIHAWDDLSEALADLPRLPSVDTVRVHFHVPLCWTGDAVLNATSAGLEDSFWARLKRGACSHLEVETYTYDVLPETLKAGPVHENMARECEWVMGRLI